jgi:hypothetical protein
VLETGGEKQRAEMGGRGSQKSPKPIQGSSADDDNDDDDYDVYKVLYLQISLHIDSLHFSKCIFLCFSYRVALFTPRNNLAPSFLISQLSSSDVTYV